MKMASNYLAVIVVVLMVLVDQARPSKLAAEMLTHPCPKNCICDPVKASMRCTHLRGGIPQPIAQQASFFSFTNKSASLSMLIIHRAIFANPVLTRDNFSHPIYADLVDLAFTLTNIETIESRTFENLPKLSRLVFKYNQNLKFVEPEAFFGLNLQRLEIHESPQLMMQRDTVFVEARTNKLVITKCGLTDFSYDVFHLLLKISLPMALLNLEGNAITSVDSRFWPLFQNVSQINLDGNSLSCIEPNYWLYSFFKARPERFLTDQSDKQLPDLACSKQNTGEMILFREAKPTDFDMKQSGTTLINGPRDGSQFYEVQVDPQNLESNPAGRSVPNIDDKEPEYEPEPLDVTVPGERLPGFGRNAGPSSVKRLMMTSPWEALASTVAPFLSSSNYIAYEDETTVVSTLPKEVGSTNTDAFFYILIIAGSVSFLSIIIGVITSVRRAATWPRNKGVIDVGNGGKGGATLLVDKSMQSKIAGNKKNKHCERLLNSSAETDCADQSSAGSGNNNNHNRCFNIIENSSNNSHRLYTNIENCKQSSSVGNHADSDQLYMLDNSAYHQHQHHSSNSTSPLLSASPQGSSHSSSDRSAILLGPLPPPAKVIRFAELELESDEC